MISTYQEMTPDRRLIEVPMLRSEAGVPPPCGVCPKARDGKPLDDADDFGDWFWDARQWFLECRAVGDFGRPDPLMRAVAAAFDAADRSGRDRALAAGIAAALGKG